MNRIEPLLKSENIPPLLINIEGLKSHSFLLIFVQEPNLSAEERRLRNWLLHTLASAARHYTKARELVKLQEQSGSDADGGVEFYVLDVSEQLEASVMALHRVLMALRRMVFTDGQNEIANITTAFEKLNSLRNQFEHMHTQIVAHETGKGPISISFADEGRSIRFRDKRVATAELRELIQVAFRRVSGLYPAFDSSSEQELGGPLKLTMTMTTQVIEARPRGSDFDQ